MTHTHTHTHTHTVLSTPTAIAISVPGQVCNVHLSCQAGMGSVYWTSRGAFALLACVQSAGLVSMLAGKDPVFKPEELGFRERGVPREFPEGVFGQKYPQNITTKQGFSSVQTLKVKPEAEHKDADRVGLDGLPHVGAVVWPSQAYYGTVDRMTCEPLLVWPLVSLRSCLLVCHGHVWAHARQAFDQLGCLTCMHLLAVLPDTWRNLTSQFAQDQM